MKRYGWLFEKAFEIKKTESYGDTEHSAMKMIEPLCLIIMSVLPLWLNDSPVVDKEVKVAFNCARNSALIHSSF